MLVLPALWSLLMLCVSLFARRGAAAWAAAAVLGAYATAHVGLFGWPTWPPSPGRHGVVFAGVVGLVGGAAIGVMRGGWPVWLVRVGCAAVGLGLVGWKRFAVEREWTLSEAASWPAMALSVAMMWWLLDGLSRRRAGGDRPDLAANDAPARPERVGAWGVASAVIGMSAAFVVIVGAAMGEGQSLGALAVALLAGAGVAVFGVRAELGAMGTGAAVMIASAMWWSVVMWAELPWWMAAGFGVAPLAACVGEAPIVRGWAPWARALMRVAAVSAVMAAVGGPSAVRELMTHSSEYGM
ncbi:MAG: hypothetical protein JNK58_04070 [Phycisphaerae bacterium]|nr:hypothetical protein [Phycisphaerae bacterium]